MIGVGDQKNVFFHGLMCCAVLCLAGSAQAIGDPGYEAYMDGRLTQAQNYWIFNGEPDDPRPTHNTGVLYLKRGQVENAVRFFNSAADLMNFAPSQAALANIYRNGATGKVQKANGAWVPGEVKPNPSLANKWQRRAAEQGFSQYNNEAQTIFRLDVPLPAAQAAAVLAPPADAPKISKQERLEKLRAGIDAYETKQYKRAQLLLEPVALLGNPSAQYFLGRAWFDDGPGIASQYGKWFGRAAKQGHPDAMVSYGYCLEGGRGVKRDYVKAKEYYEKAAQHDIPSAFFRLGQLYDHGKGVAEDRKTAEAYYRVAMAKGHKTAADALRYMYMPRVKYQPERKPMPGDEVSRIMLLVLGIAMVVGPYVNVSDDAFDRMQSAHWQKIHDDAYNDVTGLLY